MVITPFWASGVFRGTTALALLVVAATGLVSSETAVAQTFAAQLQSLAPTPALAPVAAAAAPAAANPVPPKIAAPVKTIAVSPPT